MADTKISGLPARTSGQMLGTELLVWADGAGGASNWKMVGSELVTYAGSGVQANLDTHEADLTNPHVVTAAQAGADPAGSADAVQTNLDTHEADLTNPHVVTAAQAGADPAGSADAVQTNLDTHEGLSIPTATVHGILNNGDGSSYLDNSGNYSVPVGTSWPDAPVYLSDQAAADDGLLPSGSAYTLDNGVSYTLRVKK